MRLTVIADDLTGACDAGACLAGSGPVAVTVFPALPDDQASAAALDTETRALPADAAAACVRAAASGLAGRLASGALFKKIDSTLRGPVGAEVEALLDAAGLAAALLCPAFPEQGRTVCEGLLRVHGIPVHQTRSGEDHLDTSEVAALVARQTRLPVRRLTLPDLRGSGQALERLLAAPGAAVLVADAEDPRDLERLAGAALARPGLLLAGSAGLAGALARALGIEGQAAGLPPGRAWLVVAGSLHEATRAQVGALQRAGAHGFWLSPVEAPDPARVAGVVARGQPAFIATRPAGPGVPPMTAPQAAGLLAVLTRQVLERATPSLLCLTGGDTALAVARALGMERLDVIGAPSPGLALGEMVLGSPRPGSPARLPVLTKAGGFGGPDLFLTLLGEPPP